MGDVHHCFILELASSQSQHPHLHCCWQQLLPCVQCKDISFSHILLELLVCKFEGARPTLAQWIRPQCIRMHFNISATEPAPPTTLPLVLSIRTQRSQSTTTNPKRGKEKYYQIPPLLVSIFASAQRSTIFPDVLPTLESVWWKRH